MIVDIGETVINDEGDWFLITKIEQLSCGLYMEATHYGEERYNGMLLEAPMPEMDIEPWLGIENLVLSKVKVKDLWLPYISIAGWWSEPVPGPEQYEEIMEKVAGRAGGLRSANSP